MVIDPLLVLPLSLRIDHLIVPLPVESRERGLGDCEVGYQSLDGGGGPEEYPPGGSSNSLDRGGGGGGEGCSPLSVSGKIGCGRW